MQHTSKRRNRKKAVQGQKGESMSDEQVQDNSPGIPAEMPEVQAQEKEEKNTTAQPKKDKHAIWMSKETKEEFTKQAREKGFKKAEAYLKNLLGI